MLLSTRMILQTILLFLRAKPGSLRWIKEGKASAEHYWVNDNGSHCWLVDVLIFNIICSMACISMLRHHYDYNQQPRMGDSNIADRPHNVDIRELSITWIRGQADVEREIQRNCEKTWVRWNSSTNNTKRRRFGILARNRTSSYPCYEPCIAIYCVWTA